MLIYQIRNLHDRFFDIFEKVAGDWFLGLAARLTFSSVLLMYFVSSVATKLGEGFPGVLTPNAGAYAQIVPPIAEAAGYDVEQIAFLPWGIIVYLGTYAELIIPPMILLGLFTRFASLAMIAFLLVMTFVDIRFHGIDVAAIGFFFDRIHDSAISDQRLMWIFPLIFLVLKGPGAISLDHLMRRQP